MTVHQARIVPLAAVLIGISGLVPSTRLHAQRAPQPLDELRALADQGAAEAQRSFGDRHWLGWGVPQANAEAVRWYRLAADQGDAAAQYNLGVMYSSGWGVPQDSVEAVLWYHLAADQGYAGAQYNLGVMHDIGQGVPQDYVEAVRWYRLAADQRYAGAQYNLGVMLGDGRGVPRDDVEGHMWFNLAAAQSSSEDRERYVQARDFVSQYLTVRQIAEAHRRAREWMQQAPSVTTLSGFSSVDSPK